MALQIEVSSVLERLLSAKQIDLFQEEVPRAEECEQGPFGPSVQQAGSEDSRAEREAAPSGRI